MKRQIVALTFIICCLSFINVSAQTRRPIDNEHPLWMIHIDVWNAADPQKIIDLVPDDIKPYVCMNLSLSCQYDTEKDVYKLPRCAVRTYKSWATVCQQNGLWFTCQPASGGHTHIQDDDLETFEYFFKHYPNFLGWNYAEQFWGFDEQDDESSSTQVSRIALFAKLVEMSHQYGGFLTVSFCGNIWSHALNPVGMMKRNKNLLEACRKYPEAILWLYKYTTASCWYNNESVTFSPFISGLAANYGVRYDRCGWCGAMDTTVGQNKTKYPIAAGIGTVMEQCGVNGGAVWDGPETIPDECFKESSKSTVDGYTRRNWTTYEGFRGAWIDMFRKIIDGTLYIPTRKEVIDSTRIIILANTTSGSDEDKYAAWGDLYDGLYSQDDPVCVGNAQWMDNRTYFKKTGRYRTIPVAVMLNDDLAKSIPVQVNKTAYKSRWSTQARKVAEFNSLYPEMSEGDLFVSRVQNQLITYMPYTYLNTRRTATGRVPLLYNTCDSLTLTLGMLGSGIVREYSDHIDFYLNNFRTDTTTVVAETIVIKGATAAPSYTMKKGLLAVASATDQWDAETATYTLTVKHKGGVDVTINCSGNQTPIMVAPGKTPLSSEGLGETPSYNGPVIIEAECMDYKSVKSVMLPNPYGNYFPDITDFAGLGYVDMGTNTSGSLRHQLNVKNAGDYTITVRYYCTTKAGTLQVIVNGEKQTIATEKTAKCDWRKVSLNTTLKEGLNDLRLNNTAGVPLMIDQIVYEPAGTEKEKFLVTIRDTEHGTITANKTEAAEGDTVTLSVNVEEGWQLTELRVVNSVYYTMGKTIEIQDGTGLITFVMPDDNVTLQPVFKEVGVAYKLDLSANISSSIPVGWRCVQENGEVHQYPNTYALGARIMTGFNGYQGKALYWRDNCAEYGRQSDYPLTLEVGEYKLHFTMAAWKQSPKYKVKILNVSTGSSIAASATYTSAPNANGSTSANVTSAVERELAFTVSEAGNYVISFTNESHSSGIYDEFLLLSCKLKQTGSPNAITLTNADQSQQTVIYGIGGDRRPSLRCGLNIIRTADGKTKKVIIK